MTENKKASEVDPLFGFMLENPIYSDHFTDFVGENGNKNPENKVFRWPAYLQISSIEFMCNDKNKLPKPNRK